MDDRHCLLDTRQDLTELYYSHVEDFVMPEVQRVLEAATGEDPGSVQATWRLAEDRLLARSQAFAALSYDALAVLVPRETRRSGASCGEARLCNRAPEDRHAKGLPGQRGERGLPGG